MAVFLLTRRYSAVHTLGIYVPGSGRRVPDYLPAGKEFRAGLEEINGGLSGFRAGFEEIGAGLSDFRACFSDFRARFSDFRAGLSDFREGLSGFLRGLVEVVRGAKEILRPLVEVAGGLKEFLRGLKEFHKCRRSGVAQVIRGVAGEAGVSSDTCDGAGERGGIGRGVGWIGGVWGGIVAGGGWVRGGVVRGGGGGGGVTDILGVGVKWAGGAADTLEWSGEVGAML